MSYKIGLSCRAGPPLCTPDFKFCRILCMLYLFCNFVVIILYLFCNFVVIILYLFCNFSYRYFAIGAIAYVCFYLTFCNLLETSGIHLYNSVFWLMNKSGKSKTYVGLYHFCMSAHSSAPLELCRICQS